MVDLSKPDLAGRVGASGPDVVMTDGEREAFNAAVARGLAQGADLSLITFSNEALQDIKAIRAYIALENPALAARQERRIINSLRTIEQFPDIGRPGRAAGTREISSPPWIAVYAISTNGI